MKTIFIIACLALTGCTLPQVIYIDKGYYQDAFEDNYSFSTPRSNIVNPLEQRGSGMSFMCRNALNRSDSGGAFIFC